MGEDGNSIKVNLIKQDDGGSPIRHYLVKYRAVSGSGPVFTPTSAALIPTSLGQRPAKPRWGRVVLCLADGSGALVRVLSPKFDLQLSGHVCTGTILKPLI